MHLKKSRMIGLLVILGLVFSSGAAYACHPWINANKYKLRTSDTIRFHFAYGHNYPFGHSFYDNERIEDLYLLNPAGEKQEVGPRVLGKGKSSQVQFESKGNLEEGTHLLVMETKGNFGAYTTKGYKRKSKAELKGKEIKGKVSFSQNFCKTLVNVGGKSGGDSYSKVLGHGLEIVPLKDPCQLRTNDILPLKVLHNGKPFEKSVMVYATYMGFSNEADVFAYTAWASSYKEGIAEIRLLQPGTWMIFVKHKLSYPDSKLADVYSYQATLTFEVKP
ncbi:MAG: DUF4198 domain-containing protein [Desulfobacterales bacterium]|nr:DUF4198 domain-containing protein [Desulfobacterales bacterium]